MGETNDDSFVLMPSWVFASDYVLDPAVEVESLKTVGATWGSWRTWRSCGTDNVICHDFAQAQKLLLRGMASRCNFFIPQRDYQSLGRPTDVTLYHGDFDGEIDGIEDIVAAHLAAGQSNILLLLGFDLAKMPEIQDRHHRHRSHNRRGLITSLIRRDPKIQWVVVDHHDPLAADLGKLPNLTCDSLANVLKLLIQ